MKEKKISNLMLGIIAVVLTAVVIVIIYFLPVSIKLPIAETGYSVIVQEIEDTWNSKEEQLDTDIHTKSYVFESDSKEALELQGILEKYSYHRTFATLFTPKEEQYLSGTDCGYFITINSGEEWISSSGTGEIMINGKLYDVGYFNNEKALQMQEEIKAFLDKGEGYEITD